MDCPNPKKSAAAESGIPNDALVEVLSRLPVKPLHRCKCVAKAWCDLIDDPLHRKMFPQTLHGFFYGDGEAHSGENYGHFIDPLGKSVPPLIDPSFSFLTKRPEIEKIVLLGSGNGFVLFGHRRVSDKYDSRGYIVCNPATEQWIAVPSSGWSPWSDNEAEYDERGVLTYLIFDPAASPHFQLVQLWQESSADLAGVHTYSSETGVWKPNEDREDWEQWGLDAIISKAAGCLFKSVLYLITEDISEYRSTIVAVNEEGKTSKTIRWVEKNGFPDFVDQSHGNLYCITNNVDARGVITDLFIWALEDYNTEDWVLKHSVSISHLFGRTSCIIYSYKIVAIHPDRNLVFFVQYWDCKLISYDMDSKQVCDVCNLGHGYGSITPYVPYFSGLSVLENKH